MTDHSFSLDPDKLMATVARDAAAGNPDEPTTREIAWIATYGPGSPEDALRVIASPRARRILTRQWANHCPTPDLLDAAVAPDSDDDTGLHARAVRSLLSMHTATCEACTHRLDELQSALADLGREMDRVEDTIRTWTFTVSLEVGGGIGVGASTRADDRVSHAPEQGHTLRKILDDPDLYLALTGTQRAETDRWPTVTVTTAPSVNDQHATHLTARLLVSAGVQPHLAVTLIVGGTPQNLRIAMTASTDRTTIRGEVTASGWALSDPVAIEVEITSS